MIFTDSSSEQFSTHFSSSNTIGFDAEELMEMCSEELLNLRVSVINYLNCRKLKHRNAEFMRLFHRINHELRERKITIASIKAKERKIGDGAAKSKIPARKFTFSDSLFDIDFPKFLSDKEGMKEKVELMEEEQVSLESSLKFKKKNIATNRKQSFNFRVQQRSFYR